MNEQPSQEERRRRMLLSAVLTLIPIWLAGYAIPREFGMPLWLLAVVVWSMAFAALAWWLAGRLMRRR